MANQELIREIILRAKDEASRQLIVVNQNLEKTERGLRNLQNTANDSASKIAATAKNIAGALGFGLSVAALVGFGKQVVTEIGHLQDLSDQTGISAKTLSGLKVELENAGVSIDGFATGMLRAQRGLGEATDDMRQAAKAIGLDIDELRKASPDEFLDRFAQALAKVEDRNLRVAAAAKILGRAGAEQAQIIANLADKLEDLKRRGLGEETIAKIDALGDAWNTFFDIIKKGAARAIADLAELLGIIKGSELEQFAKAGERIGQLSDQVSNLTGIPAREIQNSSIAQLGEIAKKQSPAIVALLSQIAQLKKSQQGLDISVPGKKGNVPGPSLDGSKKAEDAQKKAEEAARKFAEAVDKQVISLKGQAIALTEGEGAAKLYELQQNLIQAKTEITAQLLADKVPGAAAIANRAFAKIDVIKLARDLNSASTEAERLKIILETEPSRMPIPKGELDEFGRDIEGAIAVNKILAKTNNEGSVSFRLYAEDIDETTATIKANDDAQRALNDATLEGIKIRATPPPALQNQLAKNIDAILERGRKEAENLEGILDRSYSSLEENISKTRSTIEELNRLDPNKQNRQIQDRIRGLGQELKQLEVTKTLDDLRKSIEDTNAVADVLGGTFDSTSKKISDTQAAIESLIAKGLKPTDLEIQQLAARLKGLEVVKSIEDSLDSLSDALDKTWDGVLQGTQDLEAGLKNSLRNMFLNLAKEIFKTGVVKPLTDAIKKVLRDNLGDLEIEPGGAGGIGGLIAGVLFGSIRRTPKLSPNFTDKNGPGTSPADIADRLDYQDRVSQGLTGSGASAAATTSIEALQATATAAIEGAVTAATTAIETQSTMATTAMEAQSTITETTITGLMTEMSAAIQAEATLSQVSIESLTNIAIAAIQAEAAAARAGSVGGGGGLFGGLFGGGGNSFDALESDFGGLMGLLELGVGHEGGEVGRLATTRLINAAVFSNAKRYRTGGHIGPGERPIIAHDDEYMIRAQAAKKIGFTTLDRMNRTGELPWRGVEQPGSSRGSLSAGSNPAPATNLKVEVHVDGKVEPRDPSLTAEQAIKVSVKDLRDGGELRDAVLYAIGR
jgi:hypothetical protein